MNQRVIDFNTLLETLAGVFVRHHHITRKQLGLAGVVVLDHETFEVDLERQLLQQQAIGIVEQGKIACAAFGNQDVAAKTRIAFPQAALGRDVVDERIAAHNFFAAQRHLRTQGQIAIEQTADADDDDAAMGKDVTQPVGAACFGRNHGAAAAHGELGVKACLFQACLH